MSTTRCIYLYCDPCRDQSAGVAEPFRVDPSGYAWLEREDARRCGWHRVKSRDICDECWAAGAR